MVYVMSDIHGNMDRFKSIMKQIRLKPEDKLYVLGDVIDRYPFGIKILRQLMSMPNVEMLLGNHEHMMLEALDKPFDPWSMDQDLALRRWYNNGGDITHSKLKHTSLAVRDEVFSYLRDLPLNIDIEVNGKKYKLVHAAPEEWFSKIGYYRYDNVKDFAVWYRLRPTDPIPEDYTLIFGHTPTMEYQDENPLKIWQGEDRIDIDCGSGFPMDLAYFEPKGRLACLRLDDMQEFYSEM